MPVIRSTQTTVHEIHGARFTVHANPTTGSAELCAWRLDVPAGTPGTPHTVSREEVLHLLAGSPDVVLDGERSTLAPGDTVIVPAGSSFCLDNSGDQPATAWVTTNVGLRATLADGTVIAPPWAN
ncbi:mannose-6-phosphate isomerase-like protein (cupin superfamily) [Kitasatospora gansuensis]|uniref:Mannose-6-phosphate isomerase-like protein (Cupin superfamily) n=1 Tax=Kitasatospora gansuensis TaxID=258050 RepID=A0A7W7WL22_9ACTN|nr:cupin domain-containing protein [Kitasatospora gansuensis]MBB4950264.1 mannose-6-phosphate isomerase-like protein (cupin superfamily) [Kitasatospora gansuensis]